MKTIPLNELKVNDNIEVKIEGWGHYIGVVTLIIQDGTNKSVMLYDLINKTMRNAYIREANTVIDKGIPADFDKLKAMITESRLHNLWWKGGDLGADPEIFAINSKTGNVIPAFNYLKGKESPDYTHTVSTNSYRQSVFWDGFQAEFNLLAGGCLDQRCQSMFYGLKKVDELAKSHDKDAVLTIQSTLDISPEQIAAARPEHVTFGCSPSLNVYGMSGLKIDGSMVPFRSAGGHIHFGLHDTFKKDIPQYIKALDKILGVACVSLFHKYDNPARRTMYGLAGEYRTPKHGMEYRVLSNAWVCHPTIMYIVNELARKVIGLVQYDLINLWDATEEETIECINNCDVGLARSILKRNEKLFKDVLMAMCYKCPDKTTVVYNTFMLGMEALVNPETIYSNWDMATVNGNNYARRIYDMATHSKENYYKLLSAKV